MLMINDVTEIHQKNKLHVMIVRKHLYKRHHPKSSGLTNHIQPLSTWMNCWNSSSVQAWENQEHPTTLGDAGEKITTKNSYHIRRGSNHNNQI